MTVRDIIEQLDLAVVCGTERLDREVSGGYCGDLLSDVIAHSSPGEIWITMQSHVNIVAVAVLRELSAIILVNGRTPADETVQKAIVENIPILTTSLPAYTIAGRLYAFSHSNVM